MKRSTSLVLAVLLLSSAAMLSAAGAQETPSPEAEGPVTLVVYTYDSFISEWGPGPVIKEAFEAAHDDIILNFIAMGDSGQVLQRAILEKDRPKADVIIGIDNNLLHQSLKEEVFMPYESPALSAIDDSLLFDETLHVLPYDYGFFSIIYDTERIPTPPASLEELTDAKYEGKLIIMDPRTSSPGLGLLMWTIAQYGEDYPQYWERLKPSLLTITDGWDTGYGLFTSGEAPMVLSYTTSPAYHVEYEETTRYQAAIFEEGHYLQIEGAGIVSGAAHIEEAKLFIDFLLGQEAQSAIPLTNWMYPSDASVELPASFDYAPIPETMLNLTSSAIADEMDQWLDTWTEVMSR